MIKVTLDTNVLVSGTFWEGEAHEIIRLIGRKEITCFLSQEILKEYNTVIHSDEILEKIEERHLAIKSSVLKMIELCNIVEPTRKIDAVKDDPADNKIIECAVEANSDFIITYDQKHLLRLKEFEGIRIVSPAEFLHIAKR